MSDEHMMTVKDLIGILETMPAQADVWAQAEYQIGPMFESMVELRQDGTVLLNLDATRPG